VSRKMLELGLWIKKLSAWLCLIQVPGVAAMQRTFFEENFGASLSELRKTLKLYWINGEFA